MGWVLAFTLAVIFAAIMSSGVVPVPQGAHGQPQAGAGLPPPPTTPLSPFAGIPGLPGGGVGGVRKTLSAMREWRRADPTLINSLWRSKMGNGIRKQLGNAEVYIILALLIGVVTVVIGCWLSDNCWSPEADLGGGAMSLA